MEDFDNLIQAILRDDVGACKIYLDKLRQDPNFDINKKNEIISNGLVQINPITAAVKNQNLEIIQMLFDAGVTLGTNAPALLNSCIQNPNPQVARLLLENIINSKQGQPFLYFLRNDELGEISIMRERCYTSLEGFQKLDELDLNRAPGQASLADLFSKTLDQSKELIAALRKDVITAIKLGRKDVVKYYVSSGCSTAGFPYGGSNRYPLSFFAFYHNQPEILNYLLSVEPDRINKKFGSPQTTLLIQAVRETNESMVKLLLDAKADPNLEVTTTTPLWSAAKHGSVEIFELLYDAKVKIDIFPILDDARCDILMSLFEKGFDLGSLSGGDYTPLEMMVNRYTTIKGSPELSKLLLHQGLACAKLLLSKGLANENEGATFLKAVKLTAGKNQNIDLIQLFVDAGANMHTPIKVAGEAYSFEKGSNETVFNYALENRRASPAHLDIFNCLFLHDLKNQIKELYDEYPDDQQHINDICKRFFSCFIRLRVKFGKNGDIALDLKHMLDFEFAPEILRLKKLRSCVISNKHKKDLIKAIFELESKENKKLRIEELKAFVWDNSRAKAEYVKFKARQESGPTKEELEIKNKAEVIRPRLSDLLRNISSNLLNKDKIEILKADFNCKRIEIESIIKKTNNIIRDHDFLSKKGPQKMKHIVEVNKGRQKFLNEQSTKLKNNSDAYLIKRENELTKKIQPSFQEYNSEGGLGDIRDNLFSGDLEKIEYAENAIKDLQELYEGCLKSSNALKDVLNDLTHTHKGASNDSEKASTEQSVIKERKREEKETKETQEKKQKEEEMRAAKAQKKLKRLLAAEKKRKKNEKAKHAAEIKKREQEREAKLEQDKMLSDKGEENKDSNDSNEESSSEDEGFSYPERRRKPKKRTVGDIVQINRKGGFADSMSNLKIVLDNPPKESKVELLLDNNALLMSLTDIMDNIKLMKGATFFPQEMARKIRNAVYHNYVIFKDHKGNVEQLIQANLEIRTMSKNLYEHFTKFKESTIAPQNEDEILALINSTLLNKIIKFNNEKVEPACFKEQKQKLEGESLESEQKTKAENAHGFYPQLNPDKDINVCKREMMRGHREIKMFKKHQQDCMLDEALSNPKKIICKLAKELSEARIGEYYGQYADHFMEKDNIQEARKCKNMFGHFRRKGVVIRHADAKDRISDQQPRNASTPVLFSQNAIDSAKSPPSLSELASMPTPQRSFLPEPSDADKRRVEEGFASELGLGGLGFSQGSRFTLSPPKGSRTLGGYTPAAFSERSYALKTKGASQLDTRNGSDFPDLGLSSLAASACSFVSDKKDHKDSMENKENKGQKGDKKKDSRIKLI